MSHYPGSRCGYAGRSSSIHTTAAAARLAAPPAVFQMFLARILTARASRSVAQTLFPITGLSVLMHHGHDEDSTFVPAVKNCEREA